MAHIAKYQASAVGRLCAHYNRWIDCNSSLKRSNIDASKTHLNYNLAPERKGGQVAFINERIAALDLKRAPRKDAVRMCDCVVTMPRSLDPAKESAFFDSVYSALSEKFGRENCVSAWVHRDESQPHIHYAWVPVTEDGRLSAKSVVSRKMLNGLHHDLQERVSRDLGERVEILLDPETKGDRALKYTGLEEFKNATARLDQVEGEFKKYEKALFNVVDLHGQITEDIDKQAGALEQACKEVAAERAEAEKAREEADRQQSRANAWSVCAGKFNKEAQEAAQERDNARDEASALKEQAKALENEIDGLKRDLAEIKAYYSQEVSRVIEEKDAACRQRDAAVAELEQVISAFDQFKAEVRAFVAEVKSVVGLFMQAPTFDHIYEGLRELARQGVHLARTAADAGREFLTERDYDRSVDAIYNEVDERGEQLERKADDFIKAASEQVQRAAEDIKGRNGKHYESHEYER